MANTDFQFEVGDVLRVRQWDDMAAQYGVENNGNILCDATFVPQMRSMCGRRFTVRSCDSEHRRFVPEEYGFGSYIFSADMLEYDPEYYTSQDDDGSHTKFGDLSLLYG